MKARDLTQLTRFLVFHLLERIRSSPCSQEMAAVAACEGDETHD